MFRGMQDIELSPIAPHRIVHNVSRDESIQCDLYGTKGVVNVEQSIIVFTLV